MMQDPVVHEYTQSKPPKWFTDGATGSQRFVLTLCGSVSLEPHILASKQLVESKGCAIALGHYLSTDVAYDVEFDATSSVGWDIFQTLRQQLLDIDIAVQPVSQRHKKLLICDMDKTIVDAETLDEVAAAVGIGSQVAAITEQAMRGEIDFNTSLRHRVNLLKGRPEQIFTEMSNACRLNPGAETLLQKAKEAGIYAVLISGGFDAIARPVAQRLGFDEVHSNRLEVENGRLTGDVIEPVIDASSKRELLLSIAEELNIGLDQCCAIGDGANDIPMLEMAGLGIAYQGKPATRAGTAYQINMTSLKTALYFMGLQSD